MTKNQVARLEACNTALLETININQKVVDRGETTDEARLLAAVLITLKSIQKVLGGVVDEAKV